MAAEKDAATVSSAERGKQYEAVRDTYKDFTRKLSSLITDLLAVAKIDVFQVEARTKGVESFCEKINRKSAKYTDPIAEITDLVGLRIITYYLEDVARVGEVLKAEFHVDEKNSVDKSAGLDPDRFGYLSVQYILMLSPVRQNLTDWKQFRHIRVEVQVRTALQHAWAAVDHKLRYKNPIEVPNELKRQLYRLSALFELADEQFSALRDARERVASEYAKEVRGGQLDIPIDDASLSAYVRDSLQLDRISKIVENVGARPLGKPDPRDSATDRQDLLKLLSSIGFSSIAEFDNYLSSNILCEFTTRIDVLDDWSFRSIEDAVTLLIMLDKAVDKTIFESVYGLEDGDAFAASLKKWHSLKKIQPESLGPG